MKKNIFLLTVFAVSIAVLPSCNNANKDVWQKRAQAFLDSYSKEYQRLYLAAGEGQWLLNTHIVDGDSMTQKKADEASEVMAKFTGSKANVDSAKTFLEQKAMLTPLQVRQLEYVLYWAGGNPEAAGDIVKKRITAESNQTKLLYGFKFMMNGKETTPNKIQDILSNSINLKERQQAWESAKEVGATLKDGLSTLQELRNKCVQALGYKDFFAYQAAEYNESADGIMKICKDMIKTVWPLYRELHTWARYTLAEKYHQPVPDLIPAHWLPNRWGQDWTALVKVDGVDLDKILKPKGAEWITKQGEEFYKSIGYGSLPKNFWKNSSLYPVEEDAGYKKNTHASAWHMDLDQDVRSLQSIEANTEWWGTCLHELGHIYYYLTYSNPDVPLILRQGANRAYHEAMGSMMGLAALQIPFLEGRGLVEPGTKVNDTLLMLQESLDYIVHIPWGSGVMSGFEYALYSQNLPKDEYNKKWWELVEKYQGIAPPTGRGEKYCDAATKTHINDDPAQYYDYSMSNILLFQFHCYIAKNILHQDPHATNYWGNKEVGAWLQKLMKTGATVEWKQHLKENLGSDFSAQPMMDYFQPLMVWLKKQNAGRKYSLPETID